MTITDISIRISLEYYKLRIGDDTLYDTVAGFKSLLTCTLYGARRLPVLFSK